MRRISLFASLSDADSARIAQWATEVNVDAGEQLVSEGKLAYDFFVIETGTVEVKQGDTVVAELGPGEFFGEVGLLETGRRTASVLARTPVRLLAIYGPPFRQLEREMPEFPQRVRAAVRERLEPS